MSFIGLEELFLLSSQQYIYLLLEFFSVNVKGFEVRGDFIHLLPILLRQLGFEL